MEGVYINGYRSLAPRPPLSSLLLIARIKPVTQRQLAAIANHHQPASLPHRLLPLQHHQNTKISRARAAGRGQRERWDLDESRPSNLPLFVVFLWSLSLVWGACLASTPGAPYRPWHGTLLENLRIQSSPIKKKGKAENGRASMSESALSGQPTAKRLLGVLAGLFGPETRDGFPIYWHIIPGLPS